MLKISFAYCLCLFLAISAQFTLKMCVAARNITKPQKILKTIILEVQGRLRSSTLLRSKRLSPVLVMTSKMFLLICNCFHVKRANSGNIRIFRGCPCLTPSFERNPIPMSKKFCHKKARVLRAVHSEGFVILAYTVLIQI